MTQADIEEMLRNLAETTRYLAETSRLVREAAERIARIEAAITAGLTHLHGEGEP